MLEFVNVSYEGSGLRQLSFKLHEGECWMLWLERTGRSDALFDLTQGLLAPDAGRIEFKGHDWAGHPTGRAAAMRGLVGRVFQSFGWISNLTVAENISLRVRHHADLSPVTVKEKAEELCRAAGLDHLPQERPDFLTMAELRMAQWARAFMREPPLLLLEHPEEDVPRSSLKHLNDMIKGAAGHGTAAIWLTDEHDVFADRSIPARRFHLVSHDKTMLKEV